jgi:hypothetical protein
MSSLPKNFWKEEETEQYLMGGRHSQSPFVVVFIWFCLVLFDLVSFGFFA